MIKRLATLMQKHRKPKGLRCYDLETRAARLEPATSKPLQGG